MRTSLKVYRRWKSPVGCRFVETNAVDSGGVWLLISDSHVKGAPRPRKGIIPPSVVGFIKTTLFLLDEADRGRKKKE
jgi:hypothetical protein